MSRNHWPKSYFLISKLFYNKIFSIQFIKAGIFLNIFTIKTSLIKAIISDRTWTCGFQICIMWPYGWFSLRHQTRILVLRPWCPLPWSPNPPSVSPINPHLTTCWPPNHIVFKPNHLHSHNLITSNNFISKENAFHQIKCVCIFPANPGQRCNKVTAKCFWRVYFFISPIASF